MRYVVALAVFLSLCGCSDKPPKVSTADRLKRYEELNRLVEREGEKLYQLEQATQAAVPPVGTPAGQEWEKAHLAQGEQQKLYARLCKERDEAKAALDKP